DCRDCFGCVNLKNKQHCFFNEQLSKSEYDTRMREYQLNSFNMLERAKKVFEDFLLTQPRKHVHIVNSEQCTGDYIANSKNCVNAFLCFDGSEESADILRAAGIRDSARVTNSDPLQVGYEVTNCSNYLAGMQRLVCCMSCTGQCYNLWYCDYCDNAQDSFGCIGLKKKSYCILNKQYAKEEYETLRLQLIEHMKKTGEWGKFFPASFSPFAYNESFAIDYFPLSKEEAQQQGFRWRDVIDGASSAPTLNAQDIPDTSAEVKDKIVNETLACISCGKRYKIIKQELAFYRKQKLPIPRMCFRCRHIARLRLRSDVRLYCRQCACAEQGHNHVDKCMASFETTYPPDSR
ncbi:MAG: hypothetical protein AAB855_04565, partial [Patescibacteria group bacterium]